MKARSRYYRAWMEWKDPRRYGVECSRLLTRELSAHAMRPLGPLTNFEDAARVRRDGEASYGAAVSQARAQMRALRRRMRRALR